MAKTNVISFVGTVSELKENLEQLGIMFPNQTLKAVYEVTGLLKDSSIEDEPFIQAPAKRAKDASHIYNNECNVCGRIFKKNTIEEDFICPDCMDSLLYNVKADKLLAIVQEKFSGEEVTDAMTNAVLDIQEIRVDHKEVLKKY